MEMVVNGAPLLALIIGLVEFAKHLGVTGQWSMVLAMVLGVLFGVLWYVYAQGLQVEDFRFWFEAVVAGLVLGLSASGLYDVGKKWLGNAQ